MCQRLQTQALEENAGIPGGQSRLSEGPMVPKDLVQIAPESPSSWVKPAQAEAAPQSGSEEETS